MRKSLLVFLSVCIILILIPGCGSSNNTNITSETDAKEALLNYSPEADITSVTYNEATKSYIIVYNTAYSSYVAYIDSETGHISAMLYDADEASDPTLFPDNEEKEELIYSLDDAFSIAVQDALYTNSENSNTAIQTQQDFIPETNSYFVAFLLLNTEYQYIVSGVSGDVTQMVKINSESGEILAFRKTLSDSGKVLFYSKKTSESGEVTESTTTYANLEEFYSKNISPEYLSGEELEISGNGEEIPSGESEN